MNTEFSTKEKDAYKFSRVAYIFECMFEYFITLLTTGAYLAKLTTAIGISDSMTAILSSITSLAGTFQLISIFLANKAPVKRWVLPITFVTQALVSTLYLVPFLNVGTFAPVIFFAIMLISKAAVNVVSPAKLNWFLSLVDDQYRGNFQAKVNITSLVGSMIFTFLASLAIDKYEANGNLEGAFILLTVVIFILAIFQVLCLVIAREKKAEIKKADSPLKSVKGLFQNKAYARILIFNILWAIINSVTTPFLNTYQIRELGFSMTFISTTGIIISFLQIFVVSFFGWLSMRHSYQSILRIAYIFAAFAFVFVALSTPSNGSVMFTLYRFINLFFTSASAVSTTNLLFHITTSDERTSAIAINTISTGLVGFVITLAVSPILSLMQSADIVIFEAKLYAQQIFAAISCLLTVGLLIYYQFFCYRVIDENRKI